MITRLSQLFQSKAQVRLIEHLLTNSERLFNQSTLSQFLRVSPTTVARVVKPLVDEGIVLFERYDRGMKVFCLNQDNEKTKLLMDFHERLQRT
jgi:DNA-binding transcriptional regulator YhcF (GntR family)